MTDFFEKLKKRWGVQTPGQVVLILFIFAITGLSALYVRKLFFTLFGFDAQTSGWLKITAWILIVLPSYQILFLTYGFLFGQFDFVWRFEKKSVRRITNLFTSNK